MEKVAKSNSVSAKNNENLKGYLAKLNKTNRHLINY